MKPVIATVVLVRTLGINVVQLIEFKFELASAISGTMTASICKLEQVFLVCEL